MPSGCSRSRCRCSGRRSSWRGSRTKVPQMTVELLFEVLFAAAVVAAAAGFAAAYAERVSGRVLLVAAAVGGAAATAGWVALAFDPSDELALSAAGLTVSATALAGAA